MISFHVPSDPFAPYVEGIVIVPGANLPVVEVQGSYLVQQLANAYGNNQVFVDANIQDDITTAANSRNDGYEGLMPLPRAFPFDSSPWDWWSPDNPNHATGLQTNPDMSFAKAMIYADSIIGYFAPRAFAALKLNELTSTKSVQLSDANVRVFPNPASSEVFLYSQDGEMIREIQVLDINGRVVRHFPSVNNSMWTIQRNGIPNGVYFVHLRMDDGVLTHKLLYR
jgi:hypothetical protein